MKFNMTIELTDEAMQRVRANSFMEPPATPDADVLAKQVRYALEHRGISAVVALAEAAPVAIPFEDAVQVAVIAPTAQVSTVAEWIANEVHSLSFVTQVESVDCGEGRSLVTMLFDFL